MRLKGYNSLNNMSTETNRKISKFSYEQEMLENKENNMPKSIIEQIKELSDILNGMSYEKAMYNLGMIHGLALSYKEPESVKMESPKQVVKVEEPKKTMTIQDYADSLKDDHDKRLISLLERRGSHMNLKMEIASRWPNKSYGKTVYDILSSTGICTMSDFMTILDNPNNLGMLKYTGSVNKDDLKEFNKIFPIFKLNSEDRTKLYNLYETANEQSAGINGNLKPHNAYDVMNKFIGASSKRHVNSLLRNNINNVNQLYFYLSHHKIDEFKDLHGIGRVTESELWLYNYINNKEN